ncbi:MAG: insulinase family protein [Candidatus Pacebacteria bacterium]|nr:insulinase family protein [Candidatus Paceibacterota bacterium]
MNKYNQEKVDKINMISVPLPGTKAVTVLVMIKTGSRNETKAINGISHFLEHMMFKGTKKYPDALSLASALDSVGAEFNAFTSKEYTGYYIKVRSGKLELALEILSDMLQNSQLQQEKIDKEIGVIIEEINMYKANPMMRIEDVFETCVYGDNSAGWEVIGTAENIKKFQRKDFVNYFKKQYGASNLSLIIAGNLSKDYKKVIKKYFSNFFDAKARGKAKIKNQQTKPQMLIEYRKNDQVNLSLGVRAFPVGDKREMALKLMQIILGGSMSSRLFSEIREKRGLAYYVKAQTEFYSDSGYLAVEAGLRTKGTLEAIEVIIKEFSKLKAELVTEDELKRAKELIKGRLALNLESSDEVASYYGRQTINRDKIISPEEFLKKIDKVSAKDIREVAKEIFTNDRLNLAILGPIKESDKLKKILKF